MKSFKKFCCSIMAVTTLFCCSAFSAIADSAINVTLNGTSINFDVQPQIINSRTMVPLRAIFEALGASVEWDEDTKTITSKKNNTSISLTINNPIMYVNGKSVSLDSPATIVDGRTLVPVRAISEAYGTTVSWDDTTKTVSIISNISTPTQNSKLPFEVLKNYIVLNGKYDTEDQMYSTFDILSDSISLMLDYSPSKDEIGIFVSSESDTSEMSTLLMLRNNNADHSITTIFDSDYEFKFYGTYSAPSRNLVIEYNTFLSGMSVEKTIYAIYNLIDSYLKLYGLDVTIADFGIPYTKN